MLDLFSMSLNIKYETLAFVLHAYSTLFCSGPLKRYKDLEQACIAIAVLFGDVLVGGTVVVY